MHKYKNCGVWGTKAKVQVSRKRSHTYIHLNYVRVEVLSYIKKKMHYVDLSI